MSFLLSLMGAEKVQLSFRPGRVGWMITSPLTLAVLRKRASRWADRVTPVHAARGRYFVQPSRAYLLRVLRTAVLPGAGWDCPRRRERLRRLKLFLRAGAGSRAGTLIVRRLALRLEWMVRNGAEGALWKHTASDFDELWRTVPLFAAGFDPLEHRVLGLLCRVSG